MKLPHGFLASGAKCGIKKKNLDLGLIYCENPSTCVGFFTRNANPSYSVVLSRKNVKNRTKAVVVNSGNANCFSHKRGLSDTKKVCKKLATILKVNADNILIASTGIIGKKLPVDKIVKSLPDLINNLSLYGQDFSRSILTTDTFIKVSAKSAKAGGSKVRVVGFAKGAGMINPDLATMLAFILTDANIDKKTLRKISKEAVEESFNSITVDGCMSTNDSIYILTSSRSSSLARGADLDKFKQILKGVCLDLARMIVKDAEGASKFIKLTVSGASTPKEARKGALACANSVLFKTAMYGANPNWGRIIAALGQAGVKVREGECRIKATNLSKKEVGVTVHLNRGRFSKTVYTSDLTPNYVKINSGYS